MLKKIERITQVTEFKTGETIFKEGEFAEYLYVVVEGKVTLELFKDSSTKIRITNVLPNYAFGLSSLVDTEQKLYVSDVRAITDARVFRWRASDMERLFYLDYELGFIFMRRIAKVLKTRLQTVNAQVVSAY